MSLFCCLYSNFVLNCRQYVFFLIPKKILKNKNAGEYNCVLQFLLIGNYGNEQTAYAFICSYFNSDLTLTEIFSAR